MQKGWFISVFGGTRGVLAAPLPIRALHSLQGPKSAIGENYLSSLGSAFITHSSSLSPNHRQFSIIKAAPNILVATLASGGMIETSGRKGQFVGASLFLVGCTADNKTAYNLLHSAYSHLQAQKERPNMLGKTAEDVAKSFDAAINSDAIGALDNSIWPAPEAVKGLSQKNTKAAAAFIDAVSEDGQNLLDTPRDMAAYMRLIQETDMPWADRFIVTDSPIVLANLKAHSLNDGRKYEPLKPIAPVVGTKIAADKETELMEQVLQATRSNPNFRKALLTRIQQG